MISRNVGANFNVNKLSISSNGGIELRNIQSTARLNELDAANGEVRIGLGSNHYYLQKNESRANPFWQSIRMMNSEQVRYVEPYLPNIIKINAKQINAETVKRHPAWLQRLHTTCGEINYQRLIEVYLEHNRHTQSPGPATAAIAAIAVAIATQGTCSGWAAALIGMPSAEAVAVGAVISTKMMLAHSVLTAGFSSLIAQTTSAVVMNKGNLGHTLDTLARTDTVKSLATAMLSAGALHQLYDTLAIPVKFEERVFNEHLRYNVASSGVNALLNMVIYKQDTEQTMLGATVNTLLGTVLDANAGPNVSRTQRIIMHSTLGGLSGEIMGLGALVGAIQGLVRAEGPTIFSDKKAKNIANAEDTNNIEEIEKPNSLSDPEKVKGVARNSKPLNTAYQDKSTTLVNSKIYPIIVNALEEVTQNAVHLLAKNNIKVPKKEVHQAFTEHPALQGSPTEIQNNLIQIGKANGPVKDNRSAFIKGYEKIFMAVLDNLVDKAYAGEISEYSASSFSNAKPSLSYDVSSQSKENNWWYMAWRALTGDRSPSILAWQKQNRQNMPKSALYSDALNKAHEELRVGTRVLGALQTLGGASQIAVGAVGGALSAPTFIGPIIATSNATMGFDNVLTGISTIWTGEPQPTLLFQGANAVGQKTGLYGPQGASYIEVGLNLAPVVIPKALIFAYRSGAARTKPAMHKETFLEMNLKESSLEKLSASEYQFKSGQDKLHFDKHFRHIAEALGDSTYNLKDYLTDANWVIQNGTFSSELNGYVALVGGKGSAKAAFVGIDRVTKEITTFHLKDVSKLEKTAPGLGWTTNKKVDKMDLIGPNPELGWKTPYRKSKK